MILILGMCSCSSAAETHAKYGNNIQTEYVFFKYWSASEQQYRD